MKAPNFIVRLSSGEPAVTLNMPRLKTKRQKDRQRLYKHMQVTHTFLMNRAHACQPRMPRFLLYEMLSRSQDS